jgi:uncharacterized protein YndB with AHSA1/START domain
MRAHWLIVERDFVLPPERVFAYLAEHEHLADLFGAKIERLRDGTTDRNGVGSVRRLRIGPGVPPFEETVTVYEPYTEIQYEITQGSPLRDHVGIMTFTPTATGGTHLDYRIRLASRIPGLAAIVKRSLGGSVAKGLAVVDREG